MPSFEHELLVRLFHNRPELAPEVLRDVLGAQLPEYTEAILGCPDVPQLRPVCYTADGVVQLRDGRTRLAVAVEVQLNKDDDKPYTWPVYVCALRARLKRPVRLLVVCPDEKTAEWARTPLVIEGDPDGMVLRPWVLGPSDIPVVEDPVQARSSPELSVLSAAAHGDNESVLKATQYALDAVPEDRTLIYNDFIASKLSSAARKTWEDLMATGTYEWQTDFARKHIAEGKAEGKAEDIITFLEARGLKVNAEQQKRIRDCTDLEVLSRWVQRAAKVSKAEDLFD